MAGRNGRAIIGNLTTRLPSKAPKPGTVKNETWRKRLHEGAWRRLDFTFETRWRHETVLATIRTASFTVAMAEISIFEAGQISMRHDRIDDAAWPHRCGMTASTMRHDRIDIWKGQKYVLTFLCYSFPLYFLLFCNFSLIIMSLLRKRKRSGRRPEQFNLFP